MNYTLQAIANWQQNSTQVDKTVITLPSLQRGFVWTVAQIEDLWDSILRGYPIGAILIAKSNEQVKELLDGQQRCTSIALGHINPYENLANKSILSLKSYLPSIWIDLKPIDKGIDKKYLVRVLTQSQPWGYQSKDNKKTLSMGERKRAKEYFCSKSGESQSYIDLKSNQINPWDAHFPIPLSFILEIEASTSFEDFTKNLRDKIAFLSIQTKHSNQTTVDFSSLNNDDFRAIYEGFENAKNLLIPEISVNSTILTQEDVENRFNQDTENQDPTLFVRLNSAGTRIGGEELIYSIYKASFPKSKELVEQIGTSYIVPSKIIDLFSRIVICENNEYKSFPATLTISNFRKEIKKVDFVEKIKLLIDDKEAEKILETARTILSQNNTNVFPVFLKQILTSNYQLLLVLLIYIKKNNLHKETKSGAELSKEISANFLHLVWFTKQKDTHKTLYSKLIIENKTWQQALDSLTTENKVIPLIEPSVLRTHLCSIVINEKAYYGDEKFKFNIAEIYKNKTNDAAVSFIYWKELIDRLRGNKLLLLYAQSSYMIDKFKEFNQIERLEDTNRPWDFDHIYPNSWVYNKEKISSLVRNWVGTIGNLRVLSYDDNRSENNHFSPKERLEKDSHRADSFIVENDFVFWKDLSCNRIKEEDYKNTTIFLGAVINRFVNIYEKWYNEYYEIK